MRWLYNSKMESTYAERSISRDLWKSTWSRPRYSRVNQKLSDLLADVVRSLFFQTVFTRCYVWCSTCICNKVSNKFPNNKIRSNDYNNYMMPLYQCTRFKAKILLFPCLFIFLQCSCCCGMQRVLFFFSVLFGFCPYFMILLITELNSVGESVMNPTTIIVFIWWILADIYIQSAFSHSLSLAKHPLSLNMFIIFDIFMRKQMNIVAVEKR